MNKIIEIFKTNKYVIFWTATYVAIVWAILLFMFNFNIFVGHQWQLLMHAQIKGFAGFVFGILMLAALPMYIATTAVIIRTKKPLITINIKPVIKIFAAITPHPVPATTTTPLANTEATTQSAPESPTPDDKIPTPIPSELRGAFIRARQHIDQFAPSTFNTVPIAAPTQTPDSTAIENIGELPLPTNFDFDTPNDSDFAPSVAMPTFTDINFDDKEEDDDDMMSDTSVNIAPTPDTSNTSDEVINYLSEHGCTPRFDGNMIIAKDMIIATHADPDFWIADPDAWFAAGKQTASPITQLIKESAKHGLRPVLYLAQTNIMDLDTCRAEWHKMGVTSITDLSELPL